MNNINCSTDTQKILRCYHDIVGVHLENNTYPQIPITNQMILRIYWMRKNLKKTEFIDGKHVKIINIRTF